ncbi:hypothetical protein DIPPA_63899 [Diplonema papillatum]|nr:hypothetical protein DIPPA_63899 [Diplonema papillatum]
MPRTQTPARGRTPVGGRESSGALASSVKRPMEEVRELRVLVKRQEDMLEKQGALLMGHAQLLYELREDVLRLKEGNCRSLGPPADGHCGDSMKQITSRTLRGLTGAVERLQKDLQRTERNVANLAQKSDLSLEEPSLPLDDTHGEKSETALDTQRDTADEACPAVEVEQFRATVASTVLFQKEDYDFERQASRKSSVSRRDDGPIRGRGRLVRTAGIGEADRVTSCFSRRSSAGTEEAGKDIGSDLYSRGMAQKKRREKEILERKLREEDEEKRLLRQTPEISTRAKRARSREDKPLVARSDEWREKRELKREHLRREMRKIEDESLRPSPELNGQSLKMAALRQHQVKEQHEVQPQQEQHPGTSQLRRASPKSVSPPRSLAPGSPFSSPPHHPGIPLNYSNITSPSFSDMSADELLERLRKRREMLGLCSSESPAGKQVLPLSSPLSLAGM